MSSATAVATGLPPLVSRYLDRALPAAPGVRAAVPSRVRIRQLGLMWQRPGAHPRRFSAVQEILVAETGFSWRARFPLAPLLPVPLVVATDSFARGQGSLVVRLLGIFPMVRQSGPATDEGEVLRYLAELPLAPQAIRANPALEWEEIDESTVEVAVQLPGSRPAVRLSFDSLGNVERATGIRPRLVAGGATVPTPWGGAFTDYALLDGVRVPTRAYVWWELPAGRFTYWSGTVMSLELLP